MQLSFWQIDDPCVVAPTLYLDLFADVYFLAISLQLARFASATHSHGTSGMDSPLQLHSPEPCSCAFGNLQNDSAQDR